MFCAGILIFLYLDFLTKYIIIFMVFLIGVLGYYYFFHHVILLYQSQQSVHSVCLLIFSVPLL